MGSDSETGFKPMKPKSTNASPLLPYDFYGTMSISETERVLLARPKNMSAKSAYDVAVRTRSGPAGFIEWQTELQVYLMPNFKHKNILDYHSSDICDSQPAMTRKYFRYCGKGDKRKDEFEMTPLGGLFFTEYWLVNKFCDGIILREYLSRNMLTWPQLIKITIGIMKGLYYLHENHEFQDIDYDKAIKAFIDSTNGALKRVAFKDNWHTIHMKPQMNISIIHRDLTSKNIVLKRDFTPCIWNFGSAYIHHPFQPTNHRELIDPEIKERHLLSYYSAPEVLQERGHMSLDAMKSIDMYASGMVMWELMSRCVLPKLDHQSDYERIERECSNNYTLPLRREFGASRSHFVITENAICNERIRPYIRKSWLTGKKTFKYVQTMKNLWDPDHDARLRPATVIARMRSIGLENRDRRNNRLIQEHANADSLLRVVSRHNLGLNFQVPVAAKGDERYKVIDDDSKAPVSVKPDWLSSDTEE